MPPCPRNLAQLSYDNTPMRREPNRPRSDLRLLPLALPPLLRQRTEQWTFEEARTEMRAMIRRTASEFGLGESTAAILLRHLRWDEAQVATRVASDLDALMASAGASWEYDSDGDAGDGDGTIGETATLTCLVCFDDVPPAQTLALACGHRFCLGCWRDALCNALDSGGPGGKSALDSTCMMPDCKLKCGPRVFGAVFSGAAEDDARYTSKYEHQLALSFVNESRAAVWCPHPGCGLVVAHSSGRRNVQCEAGHRFCFTCSGPAHAPCSCEEPTDGSS